MKSVWVNAPVLNPIERVNNFLRINACVDQHEDETATNDSRIFILISFLLTAK